MLEEAKWGEYRVGDLFESSNGDFDIQKKHINGKGDWVVTAGVENNGVLGKSTVKARVFAENTFTIDMFGNVFFHGFQYKMVTHARVFSLKPKSYNLSVNQGLFISNCLRNFSHKFDYGTMCSYERIKNEVIQLPTKDGEIDFRFMEKFVAELEAYLLCSGLTDYRLTPEEEQAIQNLEQVNWEAYNFSEAFDMIKQGRRLKKEDQISGDIPFVMAGVTNTGVVNYVSNPVASFPSNSITIDIFGNTFYRSYAFGAGDDTGVYWDSNNRYTKNTMLFFATSMSKTLTGKHDFGNKLRSSESHDIPMLLPTKDDKPDYSYMDTLMQAVQKLVIRDVVDYADRKIAATKEAIK